MANDITGVWRNNRTSGLYQVVHSDYKIVEPNTGEILVMYYNVDDNDPVFFVRGTVEFKALYTKLEP